VFFIQETKYVTPMFSRAMNYNWWSSCCKCIHTTPWPDW